MTSPLLAYLFAAPLVRKYCERGDHVLHDLAFAPQTFVHVEEADYTREKEAILRELMSIRRKIRFKSEVGTRSNMLLCLTGCQVMHFTWNGSVEQQQVICEDSCGCLSPFSHTDFLEKVPEVVILSGPSSNAVAKSFILAGVSHVVAVERSTRQENVTLAFMQEFYSALLQGCALQDAFNRGKLRLTGGDEAPVALLPEGDDHSISPFCEVQTGEYTDETLTLPINHCDPASRTFVGQKVKVFETFQLMKRRTGIICITGPSGIGKTEVALQACAYATERSIFGEFFFIPLGIRNGKPAASSFADLVSRLAEGFGLDPKKITTQDRLLECINARFAGTTEPSLVVLDGCSPWLIRDSRNSVKLSSFVEEVRQRVSRLHIILTMVTQVGIAGEKVVMVSELDNLSAAKLFVSTASREVTEEELRGGMAAQIPRLLHNDSVQLFSHSVVIVALGGHPGAIIAVSRMLKDRHLLKDEEDFVINFVPEAKQRYFELGETFSAQVEECNNTNVTHFPRFRRVSQLRTTPEPPLTEGQRVWANLGRRLLRRRSAVGEVDLQMPLEHVQSQELEQHFFTVMGVGGMEHCLQDKEYNSKEAAKPFLWSPFQLSTTTDGYVKRENFVTEFWPWYKSMMSLRSRMMKEKLYWDPKNHEFISDFHLTRDESQVLLQWSSPGTFLLRASTNTRTPGLVIVYVHASKSPKVQHVLVPIKNGSFLVEVDGRERKYSTIRSLILANQDLKELYPNTPKRDVFGKAA